MSYAPLNIDPDSKNPKGLDYPIYKQRHTDYYNVWECKNKYLSLLQKEKDKQETKVEYNHLMYENERKLSDKLREDKKCDETFEIEKQSLQQQLEKKIADAHSWFETKSKELEGKYKSAKGYYDSQIKCFQEKIKQEEKKQHLQSLPVNVKQAKRVYEDSLKGYCASYKYRPKDMFIEIPADHIEYNIPPPITKEDIDSRNSLQDAYRIEAERERDEERKREIEREKARARRDMENALEEQRQIEKRKKELETREQVMQTPPPTPSNTVLDDDDEQTELVLETFEANLINYHYYSNKPNFKQSALVAFKEAKNILLKRGMTETELQQKEKDILKREGISLDEQKKDNDKPVDEETLNRNRKAYFDSLKTPPPIAPKKPAIKKPKREENLHEDIHTYGIPCA
jgi:hypothetical protein